MSVFSMIKRGRQAAKEHKATQAEKQKAQVVKLPYKHVPTHAATDAMAAAPAAARMADREKILEQNRRRSAMTANGIGMSNHGSYSIMTPVRTGMMRAHSSMIFTSSPVVYSDITPVTKNHSLGSMNAAWAPQPTEPRLLPAASSTVSSKGKEVEMPAVLETGHPSNVSRKVRSCHSPPSSGDSTMLQGELGDRAAPSNTHVNSSHRLHPSKSRRISDVATLPSQLQRVLEAPPSRYFSPQARSSQVSRRLSNTASRVPVGTVVSPDGHIGIPPVPALRPVQFNGVSCTRPSSSSGSVASATAVTESTAFTASPSGMSGIVLAEVSSQFAAATGHERDETVGGTAVTNPPAHLTPSIQGSHPSHAGQQQSKKATDPEPAPPMGAYSYMPRDFATARLMPPQRPRQISGLSMAGSDYSTNLEILPPSVESVPSTRSKPIKTKAPPQRKQWFFKGFKAAAVAV